MPTGWSLDRDVPDINLGGIQGGVQESTHSLLSGVGRIEEFPITPISDQRVESVAAQMIREAILSEEVEMLAEKVLADASLPFAPSKDAAIVLHRFVNGALPTLSDPPNWEKMTSPDEVARKVLAGEELDALDCDDKATLLASLLRIVGLHATVAFLDLNGDGVIEHAMGWVELPGEGPVLAETTDGSKPLGWFPKYVGIELLVV